MGRLYQQVQQGTVTMQVATSTAARSGTMPDRAAVSGGGPAHMSAVGPATILTTVGISAAGFAPHDRRLTPSRPATGHDFGDG